MVPIHSLRWLVGWRCQVELIDKTRWGVVQPDETDSDESEEESSGEEESDQEQGDTGLETPMDGVATVTSGLSTPATIDLRKGRKYVPCAKHTRCCVVWCCPGCQGVVRALPCLAVPFAHSGLRCVQGFGNARDAAAVPGAGEQDGAWAQATITTHRLRPHALAVLTSSLASFTCRLLWVRPP